MGIELIKKSGSISLTAPSGGGGTVDLSNYYTKPEVDALIPSIEGLATEAYVSQQIANIPAPDLSAYYTKGETDAAIDAAIDTIDLSGYALKSEIPDLAGYATEEYVQQQIDNIPAPDLSGYALKSEIPDVSGFLTAVPEEYVTESELNAKGYLTQHQSLADYSTTTQVQSMIDTAIAGITDGEAVSY